MTIGWAILGCGGVADKRIAPAIADSDTGRLIAFCSRSMDRAAEFAARHGADRAYDDLGDLLDDPQVDAVYIASPNGLHAEQAGTLLAGGKHVLCAAPLATDSEQIEALMQAARSAGVLLGAAAPARYLPGVALIRDLIEGGDLGKLLLLRAGFGYVFPPRDAWRQDRDLAGGGPLMDLAPHVVDTLRWLAGEIDTVQGQLANALFTYDVEDTAAAVLGFAGGAAGLIDVGYTYSDATLTVIGSEGSARLEPAFTPVGDWELTVTIGPETTQQSGGGERAFADAIDDFARAASARRPAPADGLAALRTIEVIEAIIESAQSGERVELRE